MLAQVSPIQPGLERSFQEKRNLFDTLSSGMTVTSGMTIMTRAMPQVAASPAAHLESSRIRPMQKNGIYLTLVRHAQTTALPAVPCRGWLLLRQLIDPLDSDQCVIRVPTWCRCSTLALPSSLV